MDALDPTPASCTPTTPIPVATTPTATVVDCLAGLTACHDELALVRSFFVTVQKLWPESEPWMVKTPWDSYPTEENLIILGNPTTLPRMPAVQSLQLRSREAFSLNNDDGANLVLGHIARPDEDVEDLFMLATPQPLSEADQHLLRGLLRIYRNQLNLLHGGEMDLLTGVFSRKLLLTHLTDQLTARIHGRRFLDDGNADYFVIISLDLLSRINAEYGHMTGDFMLQLAAEAIKASLHVDDQIFRLDGKAFGALICDISPTRIRELGEQIREKIAEQESGKARITASIGLASMHDSQLPQDAIDAAWEALNYAKAQGRNQVQDYQTLTDEGLIAAPASEKAIELF